DCTRPGGRVNRPWLRDGRGHQRHPRRECGRTALERLADSEESNLGPSVGTPTGALIKEFDVANQAAVARQIDDPCAGTGRNAAANENRLPGAIFEMNDHTVEADRSTLHAQLN